MTIKKKSNFPPKCDQICIDNVYCQTHVWPHGSTDTCLFHGGIKQGWTVSCKLN